MQGRLILLSRLLKLVRNWPTFLKNRFGWMRGEVTYYLTNGLRLTSRRYDIDGASFKKVWLQRAYDPQEFGIPFAWSKVRSVIDCGAHIGMFTLYAAQKSPRAKIICIEPDTANIRMLQKNIEQNKLEKRVTPHSIGIGNGKPVTLYTFPNDRGGNSIYKKSDDGIPMMIRTASLHELFKTEHIETCDFLKLSCEGAEYDALYALDEEHLKKIRCLYVECHAYSDDPTHTPERLQEFLLNNGFHTYRTSAFTLFATRS